MSAAWLAAPLATAAWCWRLVRRDGVVVALTSHDRDLVRGGTLFRAAPGMRPSQMEQHDRLDGQSIDLSGAISSAAIRAEDIAAGRWDGAALTLLVADWDDADAVPVVVAQGSLGSIEQREREFAAELLGPMTILDAPVVPVTSPTCRAMLGNRDCRVALAPLTAVRRAVAVSGRVVTLDAPIAAELYVLGQLRWLDGAATGLTSPVIAQGADSVTLAELPPELPALPVRVELRQGCDKRLVTCAGRFANAANFRGEGHLPGFDLLTRYPGG
jgi:uncharacterized phage protein (TIGR02218 family)